MHAILTYDRSLPVSLPKGGQKNRIRSTLAEDIHRTSRTFRLLEPWQGTPCALSTVQRVRLRPRMSAYVQPDVEAQHPQPQPQPQPQASTSAQSASGVSNTEQSLWQQSSHPVALLFLFTFRGLAIATYLLSGFFSTGFVFSVRTSVPSRGCSEAHVWSRRWSLCCFSLLISGQSRMVSPSLKGGGCVNGG